HGSKRRNNCRLSFRLIRGAASDVRSLWHTTIAMRDRPAATDPDRVTRNNQRGRQLSALKFICRRLNTIENVINQIAIVSSSDDLFWRLLPLEIKLQNWIEFLVRRQRLFIQLTRGQFR